MCDRVGVHVRGRAGRGGPGRGGLRAARATPTPSGCCAASRARGQRKDHGRLDTIPGFLPRPGEVPAGCVFAQRCALADDRCRSEAPPLVRVGADRTSRCHLPRAGARPAPGNAGRRAAARRRTTGRRAGHHASTTCRRRSAARRGQVHALAGVDLDLQPRRDARARRRVGQRQDDARPGAARADRRPTQGSRSSWTGHALRAAGRAAEPASSSGRCRSSSRTPTRR